MSGSRLGSNNSEDSNPLRRAGVYTAEDFGDIDLRASESSASDSFQSFTSSGRSSPAIFYTPIPSPIQLLPKPEDEKYLIFKASPDGKLDSFTTILTNHKDRHAGTFLIRESRVWGMLTIDFIKSDAPLSVEHVRLQCRPDAVNGYTWVNVKGSDVQRHVSDFHTRDAQPINAENFNDSQVAASLFAFLKRYGFEKENIIYAPENAAAENYRGYTKVGYEDFVSSSTGALRRSR